MTMISQPTIDVVQQLLSERYPSSNNTFSCSPITGGSINDTYHIFSNNKEYFCKVNSANKFPQLFEKECKGLGLIRQQQLFKIPDVIDCFESGSKQILMLEWIRQGSMTKKFWKHFGEKLAALHQCSGHAFGLPEDNYMGSVAQSNKESSTWIHFFEQQRLRPMVQLCSDQGLLGNSHLAGFDRLYKMLSVVFDIPGNPVLLHGDLWSGNFMCDEDEQPVLIDPAVYFGHPSVDLGMSTLFGGFDPVFYEAYHYHKPLPSNYNDQWKVSNLYPLLIHLYLFGEGYKAKIEQTLKRFTGSNF